jgi:hypothetical protein
MFRAAHRSSSGAQNYIFSLWFICPYGDRPLPTLSLGNGRSPHGNTAAYRPTSRAVTLFAASGLYVHVVTGRYQGSALATVGHLMDI